MVRLGKLSCVFYQELATGATSTVITNAYLTKQSVVTFNALTPEAAIVQPSIYALEANRGIGQWTVTHASGTGTLSFLI
jgi:hypothetical protein